MTTPRDITAVLGAAEKAVAGQKAAADAAQQAAAVASLANQPAPAEGG